MRISWMLLLCLVAAVVVGTLVWLGGKPVELIGAEGGAGRPQVQFPGPALNIGLIPERNIFQQRKRYRALSDYLATALNRQIALVTVSSYEAMLLDMAQRRVDGAFVGSLVAVLTMERLDARVLVKPELAAARSTYRGVIFVPGDSPVKAIEDLAGRSIAMVKTTTAGHLFPWTRLSELGLLSGPSPTRIVWAGTHDEVMLAVLEGQVDAGAVKDLRLEAFELSHPGVTVHRLAHSPPVPNNALIVRADLPETVASRLRHALLQMNRDSDGRAALERFGAVRFVPCGETEYEAIHDMVESLGMSWADLGIGGAAPTASAPPGG